MMTVGGQLCCPADHFGTSTQADHGTHGVPLPATSLKHQANGEEENNPRFYVNECETGGYLLNNANKQRM